MPGPTKAELQAAYGRTLPDVIGPKLDALFVGINPSLYSVVVRHHFGRPGNRFWPALHRSGFTPRLLAPAEDRCLIDHGVGLTNIARKATARGDEVTKEQLQRGGRTLVRKVRRYQPRSVAIVGLTAYRIAFEAPDASMGRQPRRLGGAPLWVLPNPSGLNAHYQLPDLARAYGELKRWLDEARADEPA